MVDYCRTPGKMMMAWTGWDRTSEDGEKQMDVRYVQKVLLTALADEFEVEGETRREIKVDS